MSNVFIVDENFDGLCNKIVLTLKNETRNLNNPRGEYICFHCYPIKNWLRFGINLHNFDIYKAKIFNCDKFECVTFDQFIQNIMLKTQEILDKR